MKQIIDGLVYDTDKAKKIGEFEEASYDDYGYLGQKITMIYQTQNGRIFIYRHYPREKSFFKRLLVGGRGREGGYITVPSDDQLLSWELKYKLGIMELKDA